MKIFKTENAEIHYLEVNGNEQGEDSLTVWAHGWGQSHKAFSKLIQPFESQGKHILGDFPGFGASPVPDTIWGVDEYADVMAALIKDQGKGAVIWIGHSFGCRVGISLAARYPELTKGLFLVSAAGLRPVGFRKWRIWFQIRLFKLAKYIFSLIGIDHASLYKRAGSGDYKKAGPMRSIAVKVINDDLSDRARKIQCPVFLVYGDEDTETRPEIGYRLQKLIPDAQMVLLEGQDHYTVLEDGRHRVAPHLKSFIETI